MDIILLGAPGAGKGTQAGLLADWAGIPTVSSGVLFRQAIEQGTELGKYATSFIERGALVPDETTVSLVRERVSLQDCSSGVILDGFPRTVGQAKALGMMLTDMGRELALVAYIEVTPELLLERLSGRWFCSECGATYHRLYSPEKVQGRCDDCGHQLERRSDDDPQVQRHRIEVYEESTAPLIEYYRAMGVLKTIDGNRGIDEIQADLRACVVEARGCEGES